MNVNSKSQVAADTKTCDASVLRRRSVRTRHQRRGLSLLEVILSIAILGGSMVMIGQLYHLGYRSALQARLRSDANILADTTMAELASGVLPLESTGDTEVPDNPGWSYAIEIQPSLQPGLFMATVIVKRGEESAAVTTSISFVRFIPDPDYEPEEDEE
jgi:general secretion pathway protein I